MEHYEVKDKKATQKVSDVYHHRKTRRMIELGRLTTPEENRAMRAEALAECGLPPVVPTPEPVTIEVHGPGPDPTVGYASAEAEKPAIVAAAAPTLPVVPSVLREATPDKAVAGSAGRGPMLTMTLESRDVRWHAALDIEHFITAGLGSDPLIARPVVASEHVAR